MTKRARKEYHRDWRKKTARRCECGNPGTVWNHGGMICERCSELEYQRDLRASWSEKTALARRKAYLFGGLSEHRIVTGNKTPSRGAVE